MVIVTDCMYRSAISAIHSLKRQGEKIIAVTTDTAPNPPAFRSRYIDKKVVLPSEQNDYITALLTLCKEYDKPVILPIGVFTLSAISQNLHEFERVSCFCVSDPTLLEAVNDKKRVKDFARHCDISVPDTDTHSFPLVVKPRCGEKFGLKASERYKIVNNDAELSSALSAFAKYDDSPVIEEYVDGYGVGVSIIIGADGNERSAFCHKRRTEYPANGGPSSSLVTFRDENIIRKSADLLKGIGFVGIAMLEYKVCNGEYVLLEINPRIWGSFSATEKCCSDFMAAYLAGARRISYNFSPRYKVGKKVKFLPNVWASAFSYLKARQFKKAMLSIADALNPFVATAIFSICDPVPAICDIFRKRR